MPHVRVTAHRRFAQFLITKPAVIEIDGVPAGEARWGTPGTIDVATGRHRLTMSYPYFGKRRTGEASIDVDLGEGETVEATYRSPWIVTNKGSLTVTSQVV